MDAVAAKGVGNIDITPLEFLTGMMLDPNVDPNLRFKAAQAAAPYCPARPLASAPPPGDLVIETPVNDDPVFKIERAKVEAIERRIDELAGLERFLEGAPLTRTEQSKLADLETQLADVPAHLKRLPEGDPELREFLEQDVWGLDAARPTLPHEDSTEIHKRPLAERPAVAAVKVLPLPDEDEAPPEPIDGDPSRANGLGHSRRPV
jgi:hypothetical protein